MRKIKILVLASDNIGGCGRFRSIWPHEYIQKHYSDLFDIQIMLSSDLIKISPIELFFLQFDIIHIHKYADPHGIYMDILKFLDKKVIIDVDDNWNLGDFHPLSEMSKKENWKQYQISHLRKADYVTTTTKIFAKECKKYNDNVYVFPNAIDAQREQFIPKPTKSNRLRFGIICGSTHLHDIELLEGMIAKLSKDVLDKVQFVLCGFDTNGKQTLILPNGQKVTQKINPLDSVWAKYEKILTNNYSIIPSEEKDFLMEFREQVDSPVNSVYRRCWTKDIETYAKHYNNIDVLLVPLRVCDFNKVKSQLKIIEAGFFHKAVIASDFGPYTIDCKSILGKNGVINEDGNSLLVEPNRDHKLWAKYVTMLANNPELVEKMGENLYQTVKDKYSIETVCKDRVNFYLDIMKENNK